MAKHNVNLLLTRQDDTNKMQEDLSACANELKGGAAQCSSGANFVIIMGDGSGQFAAAVNLTACKTRPSIQGESHWLCGLQPWGRCVHGSPGSQGLIPLR
jgi:hypothetical protein